jgi:hypothetical protein
MQKGRVIIASALSIALAMVGVMSTTAGAQTAPPITVNAKGAGTPPPGSGLGTKAALENPKCNADAIKGYGVFSFVRENDGPLCVAPAPKDNGGATYRGVTADTIKVVVINMNDEQLAAHRKNGNALPKNAASGTEGSFEAAVLDGWAVNSAVYETWGRTVEFKFMTSSGSDEASQRADAIAVKAEKPMFVIDNLSSGLSTLAGVLAADKYVVWSFGTNADDAKKQAPYRWGATDATATSINAAEFIGKQLKGGKAQYAGDDLKTKPRTYGAVVSSGADSAPLVAALKKQGVTLAVPPLEYTSNGSLSGDPAMAQQEAPAIISKLKDSGVTTVALFTDLAVTKALTVAAASQEYTPEWMITGSSYQDISLLARGYDQEEWSHAFGFSNLPPLIVGDVTVTPNAWYWGTGNGTYDVSTQNNINFLAQAIHYAGPKLNPTNVQKGLFSTPARYGAAGNDPATLQLAWGKTAGLPDPSYFARGGDFAPVWYDPNTTGSSQIYPTVAKGVTQYVNGAKRYIAGTWPTAKFKFFNPSGAVVSFSSPPVNYGPVVPCEGCPSSGGAGTASAA